MKLVSWNVNGLRACMSKGFEEYFYSTKADFFCIQETKMQPEQMDRELEGYRIFWNSAKKKGYSGTAVITRHEPERVFYDLGLDRHNTEGRTITLEYRDFFLVTVYTPNSQRDLKRIDYRMEWENDFREYLGSLDRQKPVIVCGDMNVAHREIDLKNPGPNKKNAGFTIQEREQFTSLLDSGFVDTFRCLYPEKAGAYTWWSYLYHAREKNAGWRIDYFIVSERIKERVKDSIIRADIYGSDHCPIELECV